MKHLPPAASVTPWLYWSIFPVHRAFLKLYFGQIVIKGLEYCLNLGLWFLLLNTLADGTH
jgi:hypothetical protein